MFVRIWLNTWRFKLGLRVGVKTPTMAFIVAVTKGKVCPIETLWCPEVPVYVQIIRTYVSTFCRGCFRLFQEKFQWEFLSRVWRSIFDNFIGFYALVSLYVLVILTSFLFNIPMDILIVRFNLEIYFFFIVPVWSVICPSTSLVCPVIFATYTLT